jgi:hypothetical protein
MLFDHHAVASVNDRKLSEGLPLHRIRPGGNRTVFARRDWAINKQQPPWSARMVRVALEQPPTAGRGIRDLANHILARNRAGSGRIYRGRRRLTEDRLKQRSNRQNGR